MTNEQTAVLLDQYRSRLHAAIKELKKNRPDLATGTKTDLLGREYKVYADLDEFYSITYDLGYAIEMLTGYKKPPHVG